LSFSIIDAQLRETETFDTKIGTAPLKQYLDEDEIDWLRRLRNQYVHIDLINLALSIEDQYEKQKELETHATKAVKMVIGSFFQSPGS